jgi:NodT family efflux transporter outer membrane factor (OMF) lipoprotein
MRSLTPSAWARILPAVAAAAVVAGCAVGPDYKRPAAPVPAAFKEADGWKAATPGDAAARGPWWESFGDPVLSELEAQLESSNLSIAEALANYESARQLVRSDRTGFLPTISADGSALRSRLPTATTAGKVTASTGYTADLAASWEPDFWGKLRRTVEADAAAAQASAALVASTRLATQVALADDYIQLRAADDQIRLLENAVEAYRRTLTITENKYSVGVAARSDVITAHTELDSTRAQLIGAGVGRAQLEHAIAVLLGKAPADFSLPRRQDLGLEIPSVPAVLPSDLLERRPDVAAAEREAAAANARIGIQASGYFPSISLSAADGFEGSPLSKLLTSPFRYWTLGAQVAEPLLDWGQRHDLTLSAKAAYEASANSYKLTVLTAMQQVEDDLAQLRILREQAKVQQDAVSEATQAAQIALNEYNAGTVDFTTVVTAQVTELNNRISALQIHTTQLSASVALFSATGGGWDRSKLP